MSDRLKTSENIISEGNKILMPYTNNITIYPIFYDTKYGKLSDSAFMNLEPLFIEKPIKK